MKISIARKRLKELSFALVLAVSVVSCGDTEDTGSTDAVNNAAPGTSRPLNPAVMNEPMDGSSVAAFEAGLATVREQAGEDAYRQLNSVITYSLTYDLSIRGSKEKLYQRFDGKTPKEIMQMPMR